MRETFSLEPVNGQALGGGVLLAVGAVLWAVYFLPIWTKRRQFSAAQENALRIQRTLRMLAETSDVPNEVHVEATKREVLAHERLREANERTQRAVHEAELASARLAEQQALLDAKRAKREAKALKREHLRQSRLVKQLRVFAALLGVTSVFAIIVGVTLSLLGYGVTVLGVSAASLLLSLVSLISMAPRRQTQMQHAQAQPVSTGLIAARSVREPNRTERVDRREPSQTQRQTRTVAAEALQQQLFVASADDVLHAQALLEIARRKAEEMQRHEARADRERASSEVHPAEPQKITKRAPQRPGAPVRSAPEPDQDREQVGQRVPSLSLKSMGVIDQGVDELPNLDQALLRRRNAS